jgi:hypothetical protein
VGWCLPLGAGTPSERLGQTVMTLNYALIYFFPLYIMYVICVLLRI